jgi:hypothetical protein
MSSLSRAQPRKEIEVLTNCSSVALVKSAIIAVASCHGISLRAFMPRLLENRTNDGECAGAGKIGNIGKIRLLPLISQ